MERVSVGLWRSRWAFDRFYAKYQYEGTDKWQEEFPLLNKIVTDFEGYDTGSDNGVSQSVRPCDLVVDLPVIVHVSHRHSKPFLEEPEVALGFEESLSPNEIMAGCCVLCRISGTTVTQNGQHKASGMMFVLNKNGQKLKRYGKEIVGAWLPCISPSHSEKKKHVDIL